MAEGAGAIYPIYYGVLFYMDATPWPSGCDFDLLAFTLRQVFRPFEVWSSREYVVAPFECLGFSSGPPLTVRFLATLQTIVSYGLFTLFLLALRKRFRML